MFARNKPRAKISRITVTTFDQLYDCLVDAYRDVYTEYLRPYCHEHCFRIKSHRFIFLLHKANNKTHSVASRLRLCLYGSYREQAYRIHVGLYKITFDSSLIRPCA